VAAERAAASTIKIGVIGCGYWGPNLIRNFVEAEGCAVVSVCDLNLARLAAMKARYPTIEPSTDYREVIDDPAVDAVVIATPVSTHHALAREALLAGKHVWVEKPMTLTSAEAEELIDLAACKNATLMVDHTFVYTGAVQKMKELVASGDLGHIYYYDSVRVNLGLFQHDVNVVWDLAPHDISIMTYLLDAAPLGVSAVGACHVGNGAENIAYVTIHFPDNLIAHFHDNWLAPVKVRQTLIGGSRKMILYDDLEPSEKVKVYDRGVKVGENSGEKRYQTLVAYRTGDMYAPHLDHTEALRFATSHFLECIATGRCPITNGEAGLQTIRILEAADRCLKRGARWEVL